MQCTDNDEMKNFVLLLIFLLLQSSLVFAQEEEPFIYTDKGKRDPFVPLVDENGRYLLDSEEFCTFEDLNLSGILWDPKGKSSALINNQIVKTGESIGGFRVTNVTKDSVTLFKNGKEYILRLSIEQTKE